MNKEDRITYEGFIIAFSKAPKLVYTLYDKAEDEIDRLNNIINELEKYMIKEQARIVIENTDEDEFIYTDLLIKLKELKDSD